MGYRSLLVLSDEYRGQFKVLSEDPFLSMNVGSSLTQDGHIVNQDRVAEVCSHVNEVCGPLGVTQAASERMSEVLSEAPFETPSFKPPFDGFEWKKYQLRCLNSMRAEKDVMVQSSPGTGKSLMAIGLSTRAFDDEGLDRIIVWCPSSLVQDWVRNFESSSNLSVFTPKISAKPSAREEAYLSDESEVWVLNYERLRTADFDPIMKANRKKKVCFIMDESQKVANRKSALHRNLSKMKNSLKVEKCYALTATPIMKGPEDFYNQFRILDKGVFGNVKDFERDFTYCNGEKDMWGGYVGYKDLPYMHLRCGSQIFSLDKTSPDVAKEFPSKNEIEMRIDLSPEHRRVYDEIKAFGENIGAEDRFGTLFMMYFLMICRMPEAALFDREVREFGQYAWQESGIREICERHRNKLSDRKLCSKLCLVEGKVDEILSSGEKLIIFAQHTNNCLFPLADALSKFSPLLYVGGMSDSEKESVKNEFKASKSKNFLLMSDAGQVGLNFQECRYLLHYDTPFTHAAYTQRSDRIHRVDSEFDSVTVYRITTNGTVEEQIESTVQGRKQLADEVGVGEYEELGANMSRDDIDWYCGF